MERILESLQRQMVEAVFDPSAIGSALTSMVTEGKAVTGEFFVSGEGGQFVKSAYGGTFPDGIGKMVEDYHPISPRGQAIPAMRAGRAYRDYDIISPEDIERDTAYQEFLRPLGSAFFCAVPLEASAKIFSALMLHRTVEDGPFTDAEANHFKALVSACKPAFVLADRIDRTNARTCLQMFRSAQVAFVLDRQGRIIDHSAAADKLFAEGARLRGPDGDFTLGQPRLNARVGKALRGGPIIGDRFVAPLGHQATPWRVEILPRPEIFMSADAAGGAILLLDEIGPLPPLDRALCSDFFELTVAEVDIAARLVDGRDLKTIATQRGVSIGTVRNMVKRLFAKTETTRQAELVAKLSQLRRAVNSPED